MEFTQKHTSLFSQGNIDKLNAEINDLHDEITSFWLHIENLKAKITSLSQKKVADFAALINILSGSQETNRELQDELETRTATFRKLTAELVYKSLSLEWIENSKQIEDILNEMRELRGKPQLYEHEKNKVKERYEKMSDEMHTLKKRTRAILKIIKEDVS